MTEDDPTKGESRDGVSEDSTLTAEKIERLLRDSVRGAREMDEALKRVFTLPEATALLRLK